MATKSFYENLVIETEEQLQILLKAFEDAENRVEIRPSPNSDELIRRGEKLLEEGYFDHLFV